jgi:ribulose bisphosphate carboxylase small subunit
VVDELVKHAVGDKDEVALSALQQLAADDSNSYVRMKSLRALVALGADNY